MTKLSQEALDAARTNFRIFQQREPHTAASLHHLIEEGPRLGDDVRLLRHFAASSDAPSRQSLMALTFYKDMD